MSWGFFLMLPLADSFPFLFLLVPSRTTHNSACSCPASDHPGPTVSQGRGAPEIDIFEAGKDKVNLVGQITSQSTQFAPFTHDYVYLNDTADE